MAAGNGEKAVRLYFDLVDRACGKTTQSLEVKAGPLGDLSEVPGRLGRGLRQDDLSVIKRENPVWNESWRRIKGFSSR